jgi:hypothetical protein
VEGMLGGALRPRSVTSGAASSAEGCNLTIADSSMSQMVTTRRLT